MDANLKEIKKINDSRVSRGAAQALKLYAEYLLENDASDGAPKGSWGILKEALNATSLYGMAFDVPQGFLEKLISLLPKKLATDVDSILSSTDFGCRKDDVKKVIEFLVKKIDEKK